MGNILYECTVSNCYSLNIRSGPSMSSPAVAWLQRGDKVKVDGVTNGWYKLQGQNRYGHSNYLSITKDLSKTEIVEEPPAQAPAVNIPAVDPFASIKLGTISKGSKGGKAPDSTKSTKGSNYVNIDEDGGTDTNHNNTKNNHFRGSLQKQPKGLFYLHTNSSYPTKIGSKNGIPEYNWYMNHNSPYTSSRSLVDLFKDIQEDMNITSLYSKQEINKKIHVNFNRFKIEFPDMYLKNTFGVVIFTRPDLNIFSDKLSTRKLDVASTNHPRTNLIISRYPHVAQLLTDRCGDSVSHKFNPLLSNLAQSLEVMDDSVDLLDLAETYTGYKMQYSKHNIKSMTNGNFSIKYKETFDLSVTNMHQLWVDYQSNVYRGVFEPKRKYVGNRELDYACNVYYFLLDQDGETIKFWSKYYGVTKCSAY